MDKDRSIKSYVYADSANLDLPRSIAVLLVFACHYISFLTGGGAKWTVVWHIGQLGVLIFFVHTSLVLLWPLERSNQEGQSLALPFYVRRVMRIYPLNIVFVLLAYCFDAQWVPANLWQNDTYSVHILQWQGRVSPFGCPPLVTSARSSNVCRAPGSVSRF
jgi:peptidoglycan/LPS O-acetylase OafA/YrhL